MPPPVRNSPLRRGLALFLAGLVFALGALAWMPDLHARLHGAVATACANASPAGKTLPSPAPDEDGCVITLFAHGLTSPVAPPLPLPPRPLAAVAIAALPERTLPPAPDRLHPPALAPPALA